VEETYIGVLKKADESTLKQYAEQEGMKIKEKEKLTPGAILPWGYACYV
jgi:hypothetical protein